MWHPDSIHDDAGHLDEGVIHGWLDAQLTPESAAEVESHAASCDVCAARIAEARGLVAGSSRVLSALDGIGGVVPAADGSSRRVTVAGGGSSSANAETRPTAADERRWSVRRMSVAAAAAFVFVAAAVVLQQGAGEPEAVREMITATGAELGVELRADRAAAPDVGAGAAVAGGANAASSPPVSRPPTSRAAASDVAAAEVAKVQVGAGQAVTGAVTSEAATAQAAATSLPVEEVPPSAAPPARGREVGRAVGVVQARGAAERRELPAAEAARALRSDASMQRKMLVGDVTALQPVSCWRLGGADSALRLHGMGDVAGGWQGGRILVGWQPADSVSWRQERASGDSVRLRIVGDSTPGWVVSRGEGVPCR